MILNGDRDVTHRKPAGTRPQRGALTAEEVTARWPAARAFLAVGTTAIVTGGLVAALTRPTNFTVGPWVAGYLVLAGGVAQIALGVGQAWLAGEPSSAEVRRAQLATWNAGSAVIIVGGVSSQGASPSAWFSPGSDTPERRLSRRVK